MARIACIGDGHDLLGVMTVLSDLDHEYHLVSDHQIWPSSTKSVTTQRSRMQRLLNYVEGLACDAVIVAPEYESLREQMPHLNIVPLFASLIQGHVAPGSLVNKRGIFMDSSEHAQALTEYCMHSFQGHTPTDKQQTNKKYVKKPIITTHAVPQMKYLQLTFGKRDWMMRKSWKFELGLFKDAVADTVIPGSWGLLCRGGVWHHHLNRKRIYVIDRKIIRECVEGLLPPVSNKYSVTVHTNDVEGFEKTFLSHKKWKWMLERGKSVEVKWEVIK